MQSALMWEGGPPYQSGVYSYKGCVKQILQGNHISNQLLAAGAPSGQRIWRELYNPHILMQMSFMMASPIIQFCTTTVTQLLRRFTRLTFVYNALHMQIREAHSPSAKLQCPGKGRDTMTLIPFAAEGREEGIGLSIFRLLLSLLPAKGANISYIYSMAGWQG